MELMESKMQDVIEGSIQAEAQHHMSQQQHNRNLREASGGTKDTRGLVAFLYELLRDHLPASKVEMLVRNSPTKDQPWQMTNGWLGRYAQDLAERLEGEYPFMTLEEIAWLERCAFPENLRQDLLRHFNNQRPDPQPKEANEWDAHDLSKYICEHGYVKTWQERMIYDSNATERWAFRDHIREQLAKYRSSDYQPKRNQPGTRPAPSPGAE